MRSGGGKTIRGWLTRGRGDPQQEHAVELEKLLRLLRSDYYNHSTVCGHGVFLGYINIPGWTSGCWLAARVGGWEGGRETEAPSRLLAI